MTSFKLTGLRPYIIHIWGPFESKEQEITPDINTMPDDSALIFAYSAQQANDIGYFLSIMSTVIGDQIHFYSDHQVVEILPNKPFIVCSYDYMIDFPEEVLEDLEGIGAEVDIDYESIDQQIYMVGLDRTAIPLYSLRDELENEQTIALFYVCARDREMAHEFAITEAEIMELIDADDDTIHTNIVQPSLPIGLWNPVISYQESEILMQQAGQKKH